MIQGTQADSPKIMVATGAPLNGYITAMYEELFCFLFYVSIFVHFFLFYHIIQPHTTAAPYFSASLSSKFDENIMPVIEKCLRQSIVGDIFLSY